MEGRAGVDDAFRHEPLLGIASLSFIVGIVFGLGLLGGALSGAGRSGDRAAGRRGRVWGVGLTLLRMSDDHFDLPAVRPVRLG